LLINSVLALLILLFFKWYLILHDFIVAITKKHTKGLDQKHISVYRGPFPKIFQFILFSPEQLSDFLTEVVLTGKFWENVSVHLAVSYHCVLSMFVFAMTFHFTYVYVCKCIKNKCTFHMWEGVFPDLLCCYVLNHILNIRKCGSLLCDDPVSILLTARFKFFLTKLTKIGT
jgi:hypothetical protein